jgi:nucleoside-diphosphate-sugar epimerase
MANGTVLVTGGAGYVGAMLVPRLLSEGYAVKVLDLYMYGTEVLDSVKDNPRLEQINGDIRDQTLLKTALAGTDSVIHLACISNDPSFELNPDLGRSINFDAFEPLVRISKESGVRRFIYASSSSVYGVSEADNVTEEHELKPMTDYSKFKAMCEPILLDEQSGDFNTVVVRPATVFGYSPRQRLDLVVNILTNHAVNTGQIKAFGGDQKRPNIHIDDVVELYAKLLEVPDKAIGGETFNVGHENHTICEIAESVQGVVQAEMPGRERVEIVTTPTDDKRSYHISSEKIGEQLGFRATRTIEQGVHDMVTAFKDGKLPDPMDGKRYFNIKTMQDIVLK